MWQILLFTYKRHCFSMKSTVNILNLLIHVKMNYRLYLCVTYFLFCYLTFGSITILKHITYIKLISILRKYILRLRLILEGMIQLETHVVQVHRIHGTVAANTTWSPFVVQPNGRTIHHCETTSQRQNMHLKISKASPYLATGILSIPPFL